MVTTLSSAVRIVPEVTVALSSLLTALTEADGGDCAWAEWDICRCRGEPGRGGFDLRREGVDVVTGVELAVAVERLIWHITHEAIEGLDAGLAGLQTGAVSARHQGGGGASGAQRVR